jgi:hypothetical protein
MHNFIEQVREALAHTTLEEIFGHEIAEAIGGFFGSVVAHVVGGLILLVLVGAAGWFAWFELPGRLKARTIRRGDPNRLNILVARFDGESGRDIRDRIREQMHYVFGEVTRRPFDVFYFPVTLRDIEAGEEAALVDRVERKARRWMQRARANLLIWGRAHKVAGQATVYFVYEEELPWNRPVIRGMKTVVPYGTKVYNFATSGADFSMDLATAVGIAASASRLMWRG